MTAISRRRAITIFGAAAGVAALPMLGAGRAEAAELYEWQGVALGAPARITLAHSDKAEAERLFALCAGEIERLEREFSLHRADSALARLNRDGLLVAPSLDMVRLLSEAKRYAAMTEGAFDVTVQPLWQLYSDHFSGNPADLAGPAEDTVVAARALVDYRELDVSSEKIAFGMPGMAVTLNGIAQGYVTDQVADLLRGHGIVSVLVDLGETRAVGEHPDGRPWAIGLADPFDPGNYGEVVELVDRALATSGGYGTRFSADGRHHHLFHPATGKSANHNASVSVVATQATAADAFSTALFVAPIEVAERVVTELPDVEVYVTNADGAVRHLKA